MHIIVLKKCCLCQVDYTAPCGGASPPVAETSFAGYAAPLVYCQRQALTHAAAAAAAEVQRSGAKESKQIRSALRF